MTEQTQRIFQHPLHEVDAKTTDALDDRQLLYGIYKEIRALRMLIIALVLIQAAVGLWVLVDMLRAADGV